MPGGFYTIISTFYIVKCSKDGPSLYIDFCECCFEHNLGIDLRILLGTNCQLFEKQSG